MYTNIRVWDFLFDDEEGEGVDDLFHRMNRIYLRNICICER